MELKVDIVRELREERNKRIHSMELKDNTRQHILRDGHILCGIHSMELKVVSQVLAAEKLITHESIQWN